MNCPDCGVPTLADQQYCRSCGASLMADKPRRFRPQVWGLLTLMTAFGGMTIALTGKMLEVRWLTFTGVFILMGGMFVVAALAMLRQSRPRRRRPPRHHENATTLPVDTTNKLLPVGDNDFLPSVTEGTTNLLETPAKKRAAPID